MVSIALTISGVLAILIGVAVLVFPKLLRIGVGLYLVITGILQTLGL
jgi:uncharacterized membrane protein HdeD (DUF308 family)